MEMEVNPEYLKVLGKLENVWEHKQVELGIYKKDLDEAMYAIRQLGSRPALPEEAAQFKEVVKGMISTYIRKNHDYGNSFEVSMNEEGLAAARIRLGDKWLRFKQLSKGKEALVKDESIRDTLLDMANYAIMTVMWMDNQHKSCNA